MIRNFIAYANDRLAKRRQYNRLADEIASLSSRDLADHTDACGPLTREGSALASSSRATMSAIACRKAGGACSVLRNRG